MAKEQPGSGRKKLNPEIYWLVAIFFLAVVLRTLAVLTRDMIVSDETSFVRMAENLLLGFAPYDITGTSATRFPILYPLVTASIAVMTQNEVTSGYIISVLFGSLLILPTYLFGKVMWNMRVGRAAAALVAVLPALVDEASLIDGQNLFAFWLFCALFFGYRMQFTKRCMCGMLSGTCLGFAYLANPSVFYYLVTLFVLLVIVGFRQELSNYANKAAVHFILMFLVFAIPNIAFMTWQNGSFTVGGRANEQIYAAINNLEPGSIEREQDMYSLTASGELKQTGLQEGKGIFASFLESPWDFAKALARRDYNVFFRGIHSLIPVWLLSLIGLGIFKLAWTRREALKFGYFALMMAPLVVLPMAWGDLRFAMPYLGIVMLWVARGWVYLEDWSVQTIDELAGWKSGSDKQKRRVQTVLAVLVLAPLAALAMWNVARVQYPNELKVAGEWLAAQDGQGKKIMSREASTPWYSRGTQLVLPYASIEDTLEYGTRNGADYLVMSRWITDGLRPQLEPLMDTDNAQLQYAALAPVYRSGEGTGEEVIIYKFNPVDNAGAVAACALTP